MAKPVKTAKSTLTDSIYGYGHLRHERAAWAMMTHKDTSHHDFGLSPTEMLHGRVIKDPPYFARSTRFISVGRRQRSWEKGRTKNSITRIAANSENFRVCESVQVQNQEGPYLWRWTKTGRVVKTMGHKQNRIRLDGIDRVILRYHRFLQKILPVVNTPDYSPKQPPPQKQRLIECEPPGDTPEIMEVNAMDDDEMMADNHTKDMEVEENQPPTIHQSAISIPRCSTRIRRLPRSLSSQMRGPTHDYSEPSR